MGTEVPEFTLVNQDGREIRSSALRNRILLINFIYTYCRDLCPLLTAKFVMVQEALGDEFGSRTVLLSISVDPERDTPKVLRQYAKSMGAKTGGWYFLTGDPLTVKKIANDFGVWYEKTPGGEVRHSGVVLLVDQRGRVRARYSDDALDVNHVLSDIAELLTPGPGQ